MSQTINMTASPEVYRKRRARLTARLRRPMVVCGGQARPRQYATNTYLFRAGSNYLYFGGPPIEGAAWLIEPQGDGEGGCTLFRPPAVFEEAVWVGEIPSDAALAAAAGIEQSNLASPDELASELAGREACFVGPPCLPSLEWAQSLKLHPANEDELLAIIELRLIKDEYELAALRTAADVIVQAHKDAMRAAAPGRTEAQVLAALLAGFTARGCGPAFTPGVTVHAEILHNAGYFNTLESGQLLVIDAGAEEPGGYATDVTRTSPVSGSFTPIQRHIYDTVLRANREAVATCVPGKRFRDIHDLAARVICEGLVEAELLRGDPDELTARLAHTLFFVHGLGHLMGLDVHDMEDFGDLAGYAPGRTRRPEFGNKFLRLDRDLQAGMVVTIEPGVYFIPALWQNDELVRPFADVVNRPAVDALLKDGFGGLRVEDDIHVRSAGAGGPEVLSAALPSDAEGVAALVAEI
ncbi:MAG: aminopeptidase P family protein [Phycisphaerales bacterium]|nr:MAG: aminopeptidase P family protein [Phycisphaerales bacterium]